MQPLYINVASSYYVLEEFINIDNSPWLMMTSFYPFLRYLLKPSHRALLETYREASNKAKLIRYDCRKPLQFRENSVDHILCSHFLEHVYYSEAMIITRNFHNILRPGGTAHIIVPDLAKQISHYLDKQGEPAAANDLLSWTLLTRVEQPSFTFRFLEFISGFGLQHRWLYDVASMTNMLEENKFIIIRTNDTPSKNFRKDDGSLHIVVQKPL